MPNQHAADSGPHVEHTRRRPDAVGGAFPTIPGGYRRCPPHLLAHGPRARSTTKHPVRAARSSTSDTRSNNGAGPFWHDAASALFGEGCRRAAVGQDGASSNSLSGTVGRGLGESTDVGVGVAAGTSRSAPRSPSPPPSRRGRTTRDTRCPTWPPPPSADHARRPECPHRPRPNTGRVILAGQHSGPHPFHRAATVDHRSPVASARAVATSPHAPHRCSAGCAGR